MESHEPQAIEPPIASSTIPKHTFNGTLFRPCTNRWGGGGKNSLQYHRFPFRPLGGDCKKTFPPYGEKSFVSPIFFLHLQQHYGHFQVASGSTYF